MQIDHSCIFTQWTCFHVDISPWFLRDKAEICDRAQTQRQRFFFGMWEYSVFIQSLGIKNKEYSTHVGVPFKRIYLKSFFPDTPTWQP